MQAVYIGALAYRCAHIARIRILIKIFMKKFLAGIIFASLLLVGAGCISSDSVVVDDLTVVRLSDYSFILPQDNWEISSQPTERQVFIDRGIGDYLEITADIIDESDYIDFSTADPEVQTTNVTVYRDGCGGGWCKFYDLVFEDGSQYTIFFTSDIPVNEDDMLAILTSLSK